MVLFKQNHVSSPFDLHNDRAARRRARIFESELSLLTVKYSPLVCWCWLDAGAGSSRRPPPPARFFLRATPHAELADSTACRRRVRRASQEW